jgi:hypothetical protein
LTESSIILRKYAAEKGNTMQISWAFKHFHIGNRHVFSKNTLGTSLVEEDI